MSYKEKIIEILNKDLKPASVKLYSIKLNKLYNDLGGKDNNNNHLKDTNKVLKYLEGLKTDDQLAYLNSIIKIGINDKVYIDTRTKLNSGKISKYSQNTKCDDFVEFKELLKVCPAPVFSDSVEKVINDFMLFISIRHPMRLSLWNIDVVRNKALLSDKSKNYLYITNNGMSFIMNNFKNVATFKPQAIKVYDTDAKIIREYLKFLKANNINSNKLVLNFYIKAIEYSSPEVYSRNLKKFLKQRTGKAITMNSVRTSYESALIQSDAYKNMTNEDKQQHHARLLHSGFIANLAYNKVEGCPKKSGETCNCCDKCK